MHQSGFTPGDSTTNQLVSIIYHDVCTALDDHKYIQHIFFDISKAFNKMWHMYNGLLFKMESVGIKHSLLNWFQDYLHLRKQRVVINGKTSSWKAINAGIPQRSVLCPLLIYINDISIHLSSRASLFADDTSLSKHISDHDTDNGELQSDLKIIKNWAKQWKVKFNPLKSDAPRRLNRRDDTIFVFQDHTINNAKEHRHLCRVITGLGKTIY